MEAELAESKIVQLPLLQSLDAAVRASVAKVFLDVSDMLSYPEGEVLIHGGYLSFDTGFVLLDGTAVLEGGKSDGIELNGPALLGEMAQFRSADVRSASVRSKAGAVALQFYWGDLYTRAKECMSADALLAFQTAIERVVWERFEFKNILELGMFADLSPEIRLRASLAFPSITERLSIKGVDTLFNQNTRCNGSGYLVVKGSLKLFRSDKNEKEVVAPDIIGIFPNKADRGTDWTATAMANGEAEVLKFSWETYTQELTRRLKRDEQAALVASIKNNAKRHFWH